MFEKVGQIAKLSLPILSLYAANALKAYPSTEVRSEGTNINTRQQRFLGSLLFRNTVLKQTPMMAGDLQLEPIKSKSQITNVRHLLNHLGFVTAEQQNALILVFRRFGVSEEELGKIFNQEIHSEDDLLEALLNLAQLSQDYLARRKGERWETAPKDGIEEGDLQLLAAAESLNLFSEVKPTFDHPDAICIMGARKAFMDERLKYAGHLLQQGNTTKYLLLAGGERKATPKPEIDGSPEYIAKLASEFGIAADQVTEMHLMRKAYLEQKNVYPALGNVTPAEFNAQAVNGKRPTSENNIIELCNWLREHPELRSLYIVSNQFYVEYQAAIIKTVLAQQGVNIEVAVIGSKFDFAKNPTIKIHNILGELGTQIWAKVLNLCLELDIHSKDENKLQHFEKLYAGMPICRDFVISRLRTAEPAILARASQRPAI